VTCKACGFEHNPRQDCRIAANLRANGATPPVAVTPAITPNATKPVAATHIVAKNATPAVAYHHDDLVKRIECLERRLDELTAPARSSTERSRLHRARKRELQ